MVPSMSHPAIKIQCRKNRKKKRKGEKQWKLVGKKIERRLKRTGRRGKGKEEKGGGN